MIWKFYKTDTTLEHLKIVLISYNSEVTDTCFQSVFRTTVVSHCHTAYGLHTNCYPFFFFFLIPKCGLFPATLQDFSYLMMRREITSHSADRGKSTGISNTSDAERYTASGSKQNKDSYPKTLVSLSALLPLSLRPQI